MPKTEGCTQVKISDEQKNKLMEEYKVKEEKFNNKNELIGSKLILPNLGGLIFNELGYHFLTTIDNSEIYYYNGGYYEQNGEQIIKDLVEQFLEEETKEYYKNEVVGYIRDKNYQKRNIFDSNTDLLNLQNGTYNLKTKEFTGNDPELYFLNELPITYKSKAKIKRIKEFFKQVVVSDDIPRLQEIFGYCLYRKYPIQKAIMFLGIGANGKSTTLSLLKTMLGQKNVSSISLQDLAERPFATASLYGKYANIYPDITDKALHRTGIFKMLTGGDMITAEQKFKDPFNFVNYAKLIFSANKLPEAKDDTDAYFRRWDFINFPYTFEGKKADPNLLDKLTTENEISGLFNWALQGLRRLLRNKQFTRTRTTDEMRETYKRLASPIAAFVMDCLEIQPQKYILKDDLYSAFVQYCVKNGLIIVAKNVFSMRIHEHVKVNDYRPTISGKRVQAWLGIDFCAEECCQGCQSYFLTNAGVGVHMYKVKNSPDSLDNYDIGRDGK